MYSNGGIQAFDSIVSVCCSKYSNTDRPNLIHLRPGFPPFEEFKSLILFRYNSR